jgi:hypothetical protein
VNAAALRQWRRSLRYNIAQAREDVAAMPVHAADQYYHQGYQNGRVAVMEDVVTSLDVLLAGRDAEVPGAAVVVDLDDWARAPELLEYARRRGVTTGEAVRELVNAGLSHYPGPSLIVTPAGPREESDEDHERAFEAAARDTAERDRATNGGAGYPVG